MDNDTFQQQLVSIAYEINVLAVSHSRTYCLHSDSVERR